MAHLTVRDVPEDVKQALAADARSRGQSLQSYLVTLLRRQADFVWNSAVLTEVEADLAHGEGAHDSAPRAADVLARARSERDAPPDEPKGA